MPNNSNPPISTEVATRRSFLKAATSVAVPFSTSCAASGSVNAKTEAAQDKEAGSPFKRNLAMAGYRFSRLEGLFDGSVQISGCNATWREAGIGDMNTNVFSGPQDLDVTEIGLHPFMLAYANEQFRDYTLLPIFPLRLFRHKSVFIRTDRGISKPEDLRGRAIGTPGYSSTSLTWIRGIFQEEYGISPQDLRWVVARGDSSAKMAGKASKQEGVLPDGVTITMGPEGMDESDLLTSGAVDALFHAAEPRAYIERDPQVGRLFSDYRSEERAYYKKTGVFPIMHAVAAKRSLLEENPRLANSIFEAYSQAKSLSYKKMEKIGWADSSLPWFGQELEETRELMGKNFYSYGVEANRKALETLFRYSHEQGLCKRLLTIEEVFSPELMRLSE